MKTYHNKPAVKAKYINRVRMHRLADELIQGETGHGGKGCAVWCTLDEYNHARYPVELGLPEWLAFLEDHIFEALPEKDAQDWPEAFLEAVPIGVPEKQMDSLRDRFQIFWLERQKTQINQRAFPQVAEAINGVIGRLNEALAGNEPNREAWSAAESAAWSAAESAAWSAARSAAWSAARSAAESAAWSAAESAAWSAARSAAEQEVIVKRDWLLKELRLLK